MLLYCIQLEKEDFLERLHVSSTFVQLKSVLLISCVFGVFFQNVGSQLFQFFFFFYEIVISVLSFCQSLFASQKCLVPQSRLFFSSSPQIWCVSFTSIWLLLFQLVSPAPEIFSFFFFFFFLENNFCYRFQCSFRLYEFSSLFLNAYHIDSVVKQEKGGVLKQERLTGDCVDQKVRETNERFCRLEFRSRLCWMDIFRCYKGTDTSLMRYVLTTGETVISRTISVTRCRQLKRSSGL